MGNKATRRREAPIPADLVESLGDLVSIHAKERRRPLFDISRQWVSKSMSAVPQALEHIESRHHVEDRSGDEDRHTLRRRGLVEAFTALVDAGLNLPRCTDGFLPKLSMPLRVKHCAFHTEQTITRLSAFPLALQSSCWNRSAWSSRSYSRS